MTDINISPDTIHDWINMFLWRKGYDERIGDGCSILANKYVKTWQEIPKLKYDANYIIVKADSGKPVRDVLYTARKHFNEFIGYGSDQLYLDEEDISATAKSPTKDWYFFELKKRPWSSIS